MKSLYFESQILVAPSGRSLKAITQLYGFRISDIRVSGSRLLLAPWSTMEIAKEQTTKILNELRSRNFTVIYYKICEVWIDSNNFDTLKGLKNTVYNYGT